MGDPWVTGGEGKERRRVTSQINGGLEGGVGSVTYPPFRMVHFHSSKDRIGKQVVRVLGIRSHDVDQ